MNGNEFIKRAKRYAKRTEQEFRLDAGHGKGSHSRLFIGKNFTTVKRSEISKDLLAAMLKQLGVNKKEF